MLGWAPPGRPVPDIGVWDRYCQRVARMDASRICASTEDFGQVQTAAKAQEIVEGLGGERVHIVAAARSYHRLLPSYWQEMVRTNFETRTYAQWLHDTLDKAPEDGRGWAFTTSHNVTRTVPAWLSAVSPDRYTLVVLNDSNRTLLSDSFEQMLGLPTGLLRTGSGANSSLSLNAVEVLRRLNEICKERAWRLDAYEQLTRFGFVAGALDAPRSGLDRAIPELPEWAIEPLSRLSAARVEEVKGLGVRIVGDVNDLLLPPISPVEREGIDPQTLSIEAVTSAVAKLVDLVITEGLEDRSKPKAGTKAKSKTRTTPKQVTLADRSGRELLSELERRAKRRIIRKVGPVAQRFR